MAERVNAIFMYDGKEVPSALQAMFDDWPWGKQLVNADKLVVKPSALTEAYDVVFACFADSHWEFAKSCNFEDRTERVYLKPPMSVPFIPTQVPNRYFELLHGATL